MIVAQVRRTIERRKLFKRGHHVLVGCSGGGDSVALTHALTRLSSRLELTVTVASLNHGLRPESEDEVRAVRDLAGELGVPFETRKLNLAAGPGVQARARRARYCALLDLARDVRAHRIAVGHTLDDQAETVVSRLLRGASVAGLSSISPRRSDGVVRPLIDVTRAEVHEHLEHHSLPFVTDPSNSDPRYQRVRIRSELLPALGRENPQIARALANLADDAREVRAELEEKGRLAGLNPLVSEAPIDALAALPVSVRRAFFAKWLRLHAKVRVNRAQLEEAELLLARASVEVRLPGGWVLSRRDDHLELTQTARPA